MTAGVFGIFIFSPLLCTDFSITVFYLQRSYVVLLSTFMYCIDTIHDDFAENLSILIEKELLIIHFQEHGANLSLCIVVDTVVL